MTVGVPTTRKLNFKKSGSTIGENRMKSFTLCVVALCCFVLGGQIFAQTQTVNADTFRKAGAAYFHAGNFTQAVKAYQEVIRLSPNDADAYTRLGDSYTRLNMNKEAAAAYDKSALLNEQKADRLMSGNAAPVAQPAARPAAAPARAITPPVQVAQTPAQPKPAALTGKLAQLTYKVGQRVEYVYNGKWYQAVITEIRDDSADRLDGTIYAPYRVHPIGDIGTTDTWVCCAVDSDHRTQLRPAGSGPTEPISGGAAGEARDPILRAATGGAAPANVNAGLPLGQYVCSTSANGQLIHVGGFTLRAGGVYTDEENGRGTFSVDTNRHQITFKGAGMSGQLGKYDPASIAFTLQSRITLQSRNNSVDCEQGN
jgi:hypothetical protein